MKDAIHGKMIRSQIERILTKEITREKKLPHTSGVSGA
jgi:hypothetical protein